MILRKKIEQNRFRQYLQPFSSDCSMFSSTKLTLFLLFFVGVKLGLLHQDKNSEWGILRAGW